MHKADILIVGGGIAGVGLARALCCRQDHSSSVAVLEQESHAGYHSTGRSAATWIQSYGNPTVQALNNQSYYYLNEPEGIAGGSLLSQRGLLFCVTESAEQNKEADELLLSSPSVVEIDVVKASKLVPVLNTDRYSRYLYESVTSDIDVDRLLQGWISHINKAGAKLVCNSEVLSINKVSDHWEVKTASDVWQASIVVNAAGAWADGLAQMANVKPLGLTPLRRSAAIVELSSAKEVSQWPLFAEIDETWYAKPEAGKLMVSPADEDPIDACDAWVDDFVLAGGIDRFEQGVNDTVSRVSHQWAGLRTFAPDKTPIAGFDANVDDFFWLAGHGGYGIQTSPALSELAADLILGRGEQSELITSLSAHRFFQ